MGYYTRYELEITVYGRGYEADGKEIEKVIKALKAYPFENGWAADDLVRLALNGYSEPTKGYEFASALTAVSASFPDLLFELQGQGENMGDVWVEYFRAGKWQKHTWQTPPLDESKWEETK
jgi:hypothetical protein